MVNVPYKGFFPQIHHDRCTSTFLQKTTVYNIHYTPRPMNGGQDLRSTLAVATKLRKLQPSKQLSNHLDISSLSDGQCEAFGSSIGTL